MAYKYPKEVEMLIQDLQRLDHNDEDMQMLEDTMNFYCSLWDIREGMIHALLLTIEDQWMNHGPEQNINDIKNLRRRLRLDK